MSKKLRMPIALLALSVLAGPGRVRGQVPADEAKVLEAIRKGQLKVTDEMIEAQRLKNPELKNHTNQEIRRRLEQRAAEKGQASDSEAVTAPPAARATEDQKTAAAEPPAGDSRFPAGLRRFGYDFFQNNPSTASAMGANSPSLPEYMLSSGDEIVVYTWGRDNQNQTVVIDNNGMFHYPPLQPMRAAGMRFEEAQKRITAEIEKIHGVKASVSLGRLKSIRVMVLGEAVSPGSYVVPAGATITSALFHGGGVSEIGSLRGIEVRRNGRTIGTLDLYDMLLRGSSRGDMQLLSGDAIFIPVARIQVGVTGMVKRPAIYEVKPATKVLDVLELAGGLSSNAFKGRVRMDRVESHKRKVVLDVSMEKMAGSSNPPVHDGDILFVDQVLDKEFDVVYLKGNVNRPGRYEFKKGMTVQDLIPSHKDLRSETFFNYGHIKRSSERDERALLIPFSLTEVLEKRTSVPLEPRDTVIVYSRYEIMDKPLVRAEGMVRRPGSFSFVDQMRVSDLILAAGGLTADAYLPEAHLFRMLKVGESDSLRSTLLKVNLAGIVDNPGDENNLEVRPFDSLLIFPRSNFILPKSVSIHGAVKKEGSFELTQNMGIAELVSQSEGLTKTTYKLNVEVVRKVIENDSLVKRQIHSLNLNDILAGKASFPLQDGDAVYVREVVDHHGVVLVSLAGELNFPGKYEAAKGERLSSVIRRAGGMSGSAYPRGAVFIRRSVKERQLRVLDEISAKLDEQLKNMLNQTTSEKDRASIEAMIAGRKSLVEDLRSAPYLGRIVIEVDSKYRFEREEEDLVMENGDSLFVPPVQNIVSILGEVFSPTNIVVGDETRSIGYCLNKAGGVGEFGDAGNIYYIKPDGSVVTPKNTSFFGMRKVEPGGTIVVPPKGPKKDYLDAMAKITQIIYQIAISVGVAKTVF